MTQRLVFCAKYKEELPGLSHPPLMGAIGQMLYERVSAQAFDEWLAMQMKIINEYRLDLSEKAHRDKLYGQMEAFLGLQSGDEVLEVGAPRD